MLHADCSLFESFSMARRITSPHNVHFSRVLQSFKVAAMHPACKAMCSTGVSLTVVSVAAHNLQAVMLEICAGFSVLPALAGHDGESLARAQGLQAQGDRGR